MGRELSITYTFLLVIRPILFGGCPVSCCVLDVQVQVYINEPRKDHERVSAALDQHYRPTTILSLTYHVLVSPHGMDSGEMLERGR